MRLLLDTNVLLMLVDQRPLPSVAQQAIEDLSNDLFLSVVSPWEMQIKVSVNKLSLGQPVRSIVDVELSRGTFQLLPITLDHIDALASLPDHHRDPFDRLLIAQALHEKLMIVTSDQTMARYSVPVVWE